MRKLQIYQKSLNIIEERTFILRVIKCENYAKQSSLQNLVLKIYTKGHSGSSFSGIIIIKTSLSHLRLYPPLFLLFHTFL